MSIGTEFVRHSAQLLQDDYLPKIRRCLDQLSEDDIWWRPNQSCNAVGNLVLHLAGNLRQWVVIGIGGGTDDRDRPAEFAARAGASKHELSALLQTVVQEAAAVLHRTRDDQLLEQRWIQGREVSGLAAVYHAVEHFSMHTGQIALITKLRTNRDLQFYRLDAGVPRRNW